MRKIREVLRLKFEHQLSIRKIASSYNVSRATVSDYLNRFAASGLEWPLSSNLDKSAPSLHPITGASSLLRADPPLCPVLVLKALLFHQLGWLP